MFVYATGDIDIDDILNNLTDEVTNLKAKRIVVDSLSMFSVFTKVLDKASKVIKKPDLIHSSSEELNRSQIVGILKKLDLFSTTNLIVNEEGKASDKNAEFIADGLIRLQMKVLGKELYRLITVEKMRGTKINGIPHKFEFTDKGIKIEA